ncbi:MAG: molybdopterin cofactor-binding domain-containing protein [Pseudomonadota bacterium]
MAGAITGPALSRRRFGQGAGALVLSFGLLPRIAAGQTPPAKLPGSLNDARSLDAWLSINADGTVTLFTGKVELGQGAKTALTQIAAEELDVALGRVHIVTADTARTPDEGFTSGSQTIEYSGTAIRLAGAEARHILLELAAQKLGVPLDRLTVADGTISTADSTPNKPATASYWDLVSPGLLQREATGTVKPKPPAQHSIVGTAVPRLDIPGKVTGGVAYVQDLRLPGMLFGRVVRPPSPGAVLTALDEAPARKLPGIVAILRDGSFVGVVAEREEHAIEARTRLIAGATWQEHDSLPDPKTLDAHLVGLPSQATVMGQKGTPPVGTAKTLEARYTRPFIAHASIGPSCAVAQYHDGGYQLWSHCQGVFPLRRDLAKVLGIGEDKLRVIHMEGSGCYGQNGADDVALDAALLARAVEGRPVKVQWMRDDEFAWEPYGTAMVTSAKAALDDKGLIADWHFEVWSPTHSTRPGQKGGSGLLAGWYLDKPVAPPTPVGIPQPAGGGDRNAIPLYDFPSQQVVHHFTEAQPLHVSALRTLGAHCNVFAIESFMDELALAAGADPLQFRLAHLKDPRARAVLEAVAARAHWQTREKGDGSTGRGIGFAKYKNLSTYVAIVAEVAVDRAKGTVRVVKATAAVDAGQIVNPNGLMNQIEGGIIQATSWTLKEAIEFDRRRVLTQSWADYAILTFPEVPAVDILLLDHPDERSLGAGEASTGPMAGAIANAIANATGARIRAMPLTPAKITAALG